MSTNIKYKAQAKRVAAAPLCANKCSISIAGGAAAKGGGTNETFQKFLRGSLNGVQPIFLVSTMKANQNTRYKGTLGSVGQILSTCAYSF